MKNLIFTTSIILLFASHGVTQSFTVKDVRIGDINTSYLDFEIWQEGHRFCFQNENNQGYVALLDSLTGNLVSATGKDFLFDNNLASINSSINGPEWGYSKQGAQVFYTKRVGNSRHLGQATWNGSTYLGADISANIPGNRFAVVASKDWTDMNARLLFALNSTPLPFPFAVCWSASNNTAQWDTLPYSSQSSSGPRWIDGERAALTNISVSGIGQIFKYNIDTKITQQLTFDDGNKIDAFLWTAPDYNNNQLMFCTIDDTKLRLYQKSGNIFTKLYDIQLPSTSYKYYFSAEPFVFKNKSYLFLCAANEKFVPGSQNDAKPADVWVVSLAPGAPTFRKVSDDRVALRLDPEVFITPTDAFIYYYEFKQNGDIHPVALHKCSTGLNSQTTAVENAVTKSVSFTLFPNPTSGYLQLLFSTEPIPQQGFIYNYLGQLVHTFTTQGKDSIISVSHLPIGVYFLTINNFQSKFIIQKP